MTASNVGSVVTSLLVVLHIGLRVNCRQATTHGPAMSNKRLAPSALDCRFIVRLQ